jgi:hypothetical protein
LFSGKSWFFCLWCKVSELNFALLHIVLSHTLMPKAFAIKEPVPSRCSGVSANDDEDDSSSEG